MTVVHVLLVGGKEQMRRSATKRHITPMRHKESRWDFAVGHDPRDTMGPGACGTEANATVSGIVDRARPQPAAVAASDLPPQSVLKRQSASCGTPFRTEPLAAPLCLHAEFEGLAAVFAVTAQQGKVIEHPESPLVVATVGAVTSSARPLH
jgi:hypothetical protein